MKFGVQFLYEKSSTVLKLREARLNASRILLKGVNEILSPFRRVRFLAENDC
jgi:hypothetical protein